MEAEPLPDSELVKQLQARLQRWASLGEAREYDTLANRGPGDRPTVQHALNRFSGNMGPYVDAQLSLRSVEYINASPVDNLGEGAPWFIATMCPKRETFAHFWSMVWELGSRVIINLTHEKDRLGSGPNDKREPYWPPYDERALKHLHGARAPRHWPVEPHTLGCQTCEQVPSLLRYSIELRGPKEEATDGERPRRVVALYWYRRWVDFPNPTSIGSRPFYENSWAILHVALHISAELSRLGDDHWAICHCSAGVGRTGTFIALVTMLRTLAGHGLPSLDTAVTEVIESMRERRLWMVKSQSEYATLYAALFLRLQNPQDADFSLSWPHGVGDTSALQLPPFADAEPPPPPPAAADVAMPAAAPEAAAADAELASGSATDGATSLPPAAAASDGACVGLDEAGASAAGAGGGVGADFAADDFAAVSSAIEAMEVVGAEGSSDAPPEAAGGARREERREDGWKANGGSPPPLGGITDRAEVDNTADVKRYDGV